MTQDDVFEQSQGDNWFKHNRAALNDPAHVRADVALGVLAECTSLQPTRVLEIDCANGCLAEVRTRYACGCVGVDPAWEAPPNSP